MRMAGYPLLPQLRETMPGKPRKHLREFDQRGGEQPVALRHLSGYRSNVGYRLRNRIAQVCVQANIEPDADHRGGGVPAVVVQLD